MKLRTTIEQTGPSTAGIPVPDESSPRSAAVAVPP